MDNWIRKLRERRGLTQAELATMVGTSQQQIDRVEKAGGNVRLEWIRKLSPALGVAPSDWLDQSVGTDPLIGYIRVIGAVEAGVWAEALEWDEENQYTLPVGPDPERPSLPRFGLLTRGPSMNLVMPEGTVLICALVADLGENPMPGDYVICRRRRNGEAEMTVKEYVVDEDGRHWLVPRSDHPAHQQAYPLDDGRDPDFDQDEIVVHALVLSYQVPARANRRPKPPPKRGATPRK